MKNVVAWGFFLFNSYEKAKLNGSNENQWKEEEEEEEEEKKEALRLVFLELVPPKKKEKSFLGIVVQSFRAPSVKAEVASLSPNLVLSIVSITPFVLFFLSCLKSQTF